MKSFLALVPLAFVLIACDPAPAENSETNTEDTTATQSSTVPTPEGGTTGSVQIHTTGGGMAPVTGTESLQGGGGGVNQAAKDSARKAAVNAGGSSLDQLNSGDE